jgi:hypothetical protein
MVRIESVAIDSPAAMNPITNVMLMSMTAPIRDGLSSQSRPD